jgi:hypothetical protein
MKLNTAIRTEEIKKLESILYEIKMLAQSLLD